MMYHMKHASVFKRTFLNKYMSNTVECTTTPLTISDIPRRKTLPLIGTKLEFIAAGSGTKLHEYIDRRHKQLGHVFREKLGGNTDLVFVSDPMLIRDLLLNLEGKYPAHILPEPWLLYEKLYGSKRGLLFMNGEEWLENRRVMNKFLLKEGSDDWLEDPVKITVVNFIKRWQSQAKDGKFVPDLETEFYRLSIDVIISVMLGYQSNLRPTKNYDMLLQKFSESVKKIFQTTTTLYGLPINLCQRLNLKVWRDFKDCVDDSLNLAHKIVSEILINKQSSNGLVKMLSDNNVADETVKKIMGDFVIAAGDTTSYTSLWTLQLLSKHKNIRDKICTVNSNHIQCIIKESMRLYPVAPFLTRILPQDSQLGLYQLKAGTPVIASIYTSGRDECNFSKANQFLPYRWDRNDIRKKELVNHVPFASLPFALGARSCIGKKLAMLQMTEVLTQIVEKFEFKCMNNKAVNANTSQVLVPDTDIKLQFTLKNKK